MFKYGREKAEEFFKEIRQLTAQVRLEVKDETLSEQEICKSVIFYEEKFLKKQILHLNFEHSSDFVLFRNEILNLKSRLSES